MSCSTGSPRWQEDRSPGAATRHAHCRVGEARGGAAGRLRRCMAGLRSTRPLADMRELNGKRQTNRGEPSQRPEKHGPRSASGKKRASRNAFRHGLSRPMLGLGIPRTVDDLARGSPGTRLITPNFAGPRRRRSHARTCPSLALQGSPHRIRRSPWRARPRDGVADPTFRRRSCSGGPIKAGSQWRVSAACRGITANRRDGALCLPALLRLQRYETRAAAKRDQAIRKLAF